MERDNGQTNRRRRHCIRPMPVRQGRLRDRRAGALGLARPFRSRAAARMARPTPPMSAAGASAFASSRARPGSRATRTRRPAPRAVSVRPAARRLFYERARSPHMVNIPRALFSGRTGRQPLYHIAIEELQEWAYTGEPLVPLKGFPGVVWQRSKKKKRRARGDVLRTRAVRAHFAPEARQTPVRVLRRIRQFLRASSPAMRDRRRGDPWRRLASARLPPAAVRPVPCSRLPCSPP